MKEIWESIKLFIAGHKAASIAVASVVGVSAVGAGGYGIYSLVDAEEVPVEVAQVEEEYQAADVYIPEFKSVFITSESLEKDLTVYISDENDNPIAGVPFQIKLLTPEAAEGLQSYVDAIDNLDSEINKYVSEYSSTDEEDTTAAEDDGSLPVDGEEIDFSDSEENEAAEEKESVDVATLPNTADRVMEILEERNVDVTVTDEDGNVVETQHGDISTDPLYTLLIDKETAVQSFAVALNEAEGTVFTDDDQDGIISETDLEPGDYVICLVNDVEAQVSYEPSTYETAANVKDKVEYKVQKEIIKQVKKDVASEDGQKAAAAEVPVENVQTDTVEYVESKKVENGSSVKSTTEAVAPKTTASASKATKKDGAVVEVTGKIAKTTSRAIIKVNGAVAVATKNLAVNLFGNAIKTAEQPSTETQTTSETQDETTTEQQTTVKYKITFKCVCGDVTLKTVEQEVESGKEYTYTAPAIDGYTEPSNKTVTGTASKDETITLTYSQKETATQEPAKTTHTITIKCVDTANAALTPDDNKTSVTVESGSDYSAITAPTVTGYTLQSRNPASGTISADGTITFTYKKNETATETVDAKVTLDMSYKEGTFTIKSTGTNGAAVTNVTVNGAAVTLKDGTATYKATKDGDYTLAGVVKFADGEKQLSVTYTVSGFGTASTDPLVDKAGNQLYLDEACTKAATAADYEQGKTYYYKAATYTYYGWQSIDGNTYYFDKNGNKVTGTQIIQGVSYDFGTDGVLANKGTGIDVSKYQATIDWSQTKSAVSFAIVRCGYRGMNDGQLHEDPYFYKNMSGAKANGVSVGVYIYSTALNEAEAVQEASMAVAMAQKAGGCSYPIFIDMEDKVRGQSSLSTAQRMAIVNAFVSTVQSSGYKAGVYCSKNWMTSLMDANSIPGSCSVWIAQYNTSCTYSGRKNIWQYSSKGSVPGIKGYVDMNKSF